MFETSNYDNLVIQFKKGEILLKLQDIRCTNCGAQVNLHEKKRIITCDYCSSQFLYEPASEFANIDKTEAQQVGKLRTNLQDAIKINNLEEIKRTASLIKDMIPSDYKANYYLSYYYDTSGISSHIHNFLNGKIIGTPTETKEVINHISRFGELRDKDLVMKYIESVDPSFLPDYLDTFKQRKTKIDLYDSTLRRDVFICHRSTDIDIVKQIVTSIEKDGYECWVSYRNLKPNDTKNYWISIQEAIRSCKLFLIISSEGAMLSKDVQKELKYAVENNKDRIEYKIDEELRTRLFKDSFDGIQWVDGTDEKGLIYLLDRIHNELSKKSTSLKKTSIFKRVVTNKFVLVIIAFLLLWQLVYWFAYWGGTDRLFSAFNGETCPSGYETRLEGCVPNDQDDLPNELPSFEILDVNWEDGIVVMEYSVSNLYGYMGVLDIRIFDDEGMVDTQILDLNNSTLLFHDINDNVSYNIRFTTDYDNGYEEIRYTIYEEEITIPDISLPKNLNASALAIDDNSIPMYIEYVSDGVEVTYTIKVYQNDNLVDSFTLDTVPVSSVVQENLTFYDLNSNSYYIVYLDIVNPMGISNNFSNIFNVTQRVKLFSTTTD